MQGARMVVKVISCSILLLVLCSNNAWGKQNRVTRYIFTWELYSSIRIFLGLKEEPFGGKGAMEA